MRRRTALAVITLVILAAGGMVAVTTASRDSRAKTKMAAVTNPFAGAGTVSYPTPEQLPYDREENALWRAVSIT